MKKIKIISHNDQDELEKKVTAFMNDPKKCKAVLSLAYSSAVNPPQNRLWYQCCVFYVG